MKKQIAIVTVLIAIAIVLLLSERTERSGVTSELPASVFSVERKSDQATSDSRTSIALNAATASRSALDQNAAIAKSEIEAARAETETCKHHWLAWYSQRQDANSFLAAAVLSVPTEESRREDRQARLRAAQSSLDEAIAASPNDPTLRRLAVSICAAIEGCDLAERVSALREADPKNGAAWLDLMRTMNDESEIEGILKNLASAERIDFHWLSVSAAVVESIKQAPVSPPKSIANCGVMLANEALAGLANVSLPSFKSLIDACNSHESRRETCLRISKTLRESDLLLAQGIGFRIAREAIAPESAEGRLLAAQWREFRWLMIQGAPLMNMSSPDWQRWQRDYRREADLVRAIMRENGIPLQPPPEWRP